MRRNPLRLVALLSGNIPSVQFCDVTCITIHGSHSELWLKCNGVEELIQALISIASTGVLLATGGIDGSVYRPLPHSLEELIKSSMYRGVINSGTAVVVQPCNTDPGQALVSLLPYSKNIVLKRGSPKVTVVLSKPMSIEQLFDSGIRLLKPVTTPAILLPRPRKRRLHGALGEEHLNV